MTPLKYVEVTLDVDNLKQVEDTIKVCRWHFIVDVNLKQVDDTIKVCRWHFIVDNLKQVDDTIKVCRWHCIVSRCSLNSSNKH